MKSRDSSTIWLIDFRLASTRLCMLISLAGSIADWLVYDFHFKFKVSFCVLMNGKIFQKVVESSEGKRVNGRHWNLCFHEQLFLFLLSAGRLATAVDRLAINNVLGVTRKHFGFCNFNAAQMVVDATASLSCWRASLLTAVRISTLRSHKENMTWFITVDWGNNQQAVTQSFDGIIADNASLILLLQQKGFCSRSLCFTVRQISRI